MLKLEAITLRRGPEALLESASALIHAGQRVAIIGANGAGKTSLFKLILGQLSLDAGEYALSGNCRIAHMAQEIHSVDQTALDFVIDGHEELRSLEARLKDAEDRGNDNLYAEYLGKLEEIQAFKVPAEAEKLLHGLGFKQSDMQRSVDDFSGGWRIRLNLAKALMSPSDLLLLDEPTNHLDLDAMLWLERWLKSYTGTLLLISHDRDFIDAVATHVLQFEQKLLHQYTGGYSSFERQRAQKMAQQQSQYEKQQRRIQEIESFVRRFKAKATKAKQAQSRLKELDRMAEIEPAHVDSPFHFRFPDAEKISSPLLGLHQSSIGYQGTKPIIDSFTQSILPDTRVGLLGPNGAGKSTLVKSLVGDLELLSGQRVCGEHLKIGYFAQHQLEALDLDASPYLHLQRLNSKATEQEIRNFLGGFDFRGDKALEVIRNFSGGEKARLALAIIAWQGPNLLILDEPTNHLDLEMRHALMMALQEFSGAIILVSHDRHLLKHSVDQFWLVAQGSVEPFDGDLQDYEKWLTEFQRSANEANEHERPSGQEDRKARKRQEAEKRQRLSPLKNALKKSEQLMEKYQKELESLEVSLSDPALYMEENKEKLKRILLEQSKVKEALEVEELQWFDLSEQIESIDQSNT